MQLMIQCRELDTYTWRPFGTPKPICCSFQVIPHSQYSSRIDGSCHAKTCRRPPRSAQEPIAHRLEWWGIYARRQSRFAIRLSDAVVVGEPHQVPILNRTAVTKTSHIVQRVTRPGKTNTHATDGKAISTLSLQGFGSVSLLQAGWSTTIQLQLVIYTASTLVSPCLPVIPEFDRRVRLLPSTERKRAVLPAQRRYIPATWTKPIVRVYSPAVTDIESRH
jgi:hypothetical protein